MSQGRTFAPETALLTAALAGLMGGCGTKEKEKIVYAEKQGAISASTIDKTITLASFTTTCEARNGIVETMSSCGGANTCAGLAWHSPSGKLSEHSCKGANICAGMNCVDLPTDHGLTAEQILEGNVDDAVYAIPNQCTSCHEDGKDSFSLPVAPDADATATVNAFNAKPDSALIAAIAFGIHGVYTNASSTNGVAYSNMPAFYKSYSLAEIKRLVAHIRTLPAVAKPWESPH